MPKTLFVVDDSATMRKVFELTFAGEDVTVVTHDGSEGAVSRARELRPHAIVVDVNLGAASGYDLVRALRGDGHGGVPIYLLYSDQSPLDDGAARSCGASGAMAKPFDSQAMIDRMRQALAAPASAAAPAAPAATPPVAAPPVAAAPVATPPVAPAPARPSLGAPVAPGPSPLRPATAPLAPVGAARPLAPASAPLPPPTAPSPTPPLGRTPLGTPAAPMPARPMPTAAPVPARPSPFADAEKAPALSLDDDLLGDLSQPPAAPAPRPMQSPSGSSFPAVPKAAPALSPVEPTAVKAPPAPAVEAPVAAPVVAPVAAPVVAPVAAPVVAPVVAAAAPVAAVDGAVRAAAEGVAERVAGLGLSPAQVEAITALTREVVERVVWEVVPVLAETIIREEIDRLTRA